MADFGKLKGDMDFAKLPVLTKQETSIGVPKAAGDIAIDDVDINVIRVAGANGLEDRSTIHDGHVEVVGVSRGAVDLGTQHNFDFLE